MCEVFVQCKAKPAKPCSSLELDQVRLADELDSESRRRGDVRPQLFSQTVDLKHRSYYSAKTQEMRQRKRKLSWPLRAFKWGDSLHKRRERFNGKEN